MIGSIASWFGSNRMLAEEVGKLLTGYSWVGVPFAGGMSELKHIEARTLMINDTHRHVINLAKVIGDPVLGPKLYRSLKRIPFHVGVLDEAQIACREVEQQGFQNVDPLIWAIAYFVTAWMARHGNAGTAKEFKVGMSIRWDAQGGDSAKHYWSAVESLKDWRKILQRGNFTTLDFRDFLAHCKDIEENAIYCDPPFLGPGDKYKNVMTEQDHIELAQILNSFEKARIVCRFYDIEFVREQYPDDKWHYKFLTGRKQSNKTAQELLITRN